jgi:hypothetical protein
MSRLEYQREYRRKNADRLREKILLKAKERRNELILKGLNETARRDTETN